MTATPATSDMFGFAATPVDAIAGLVADARAAFDAGSTKPLSWRLDTLAALRSALVDREAELLEALRLDLGKPTFEAWTADIGFGISEIDHSVAHLRSWLKPRRVRTPLTFTPGTSQLVPAPPGVEVVSPQAMVTSLNGAPSASATTCA